MRQKRSITPSHHLLPQELRGKDIGRPCTEVFVEALHAINPDVHLTTMPENVSAENITELAQPADLIVDGAPIFEERYLMNQEAVRQNKPLVMAAMYRD